MLGLWYNNDILIVKTADGYYSCDTTTDTTLVLDETWNSLTSDVVDIYGKYVLLNDGYVYEFPEY